MIKFLLLRNIGRRLPSIVVSLAAIMLVVGGCASDKAAPSQAKSAETSLLSDPDVANGTTYEVHVYVVTRGDTLAAIAGKFQVTSAQLKAINPGIRANWLKVGQQIRVLEKRIE